MMNIEAAGGSIIIGTLDKDGKFKRGVDFKKAIKWYKEHNLDTSISFLHLVISRSSIELVKSGKFENAHVYRSVDNKKNENTIFFRTIKIKK